MLIKSPTIVELFSDRIAAESLEPALAVKRKGQYEWTPWIEVADDVDQLAAALLSIGVQPGDRVAHISENRYEWIITDLAIQIARAVHVPIHPTLAGPQIAWQLKHCGCRIAFISGQHQAEKLAPLADELPEGLLFFSFDDFPSSNLPLCVNSFLELCERPTDVHSDRVQRSLGERIDPQALATILYTSGTTGEPKGVMLTQRNLASNAVSAVETFGYVPDQTRLNFLPLSHIFARTCDLYCWLVEGSRLALAESRETVLADCQAVKPHSLNGVPYFYDKVYRHLCSTGKQDEPGILSAALGGAIQRCCAGGAALPDYLYDYYHGQGVPLLQGYGLSESSPVITMSTERNHRRGSCGRPIPGIEVKIADDGEILTRGPHVMPGYYKNEQATHDVLQNGWLATGDIGRQDSDGFLYITGRKKEILVTLGGKNIAPVYLESLLTEDRLILQAMIIGDGKSYLSALVVPNSDVLKSEQQKLALSDHSLKDLPLAEALTHPKILSLYRAHINHLLKNVSPHEQIGQFHLLETPFTIDSGELTPKLSLRRQQISHRYSAEIAALYNTKKC